MQRLVIDVDDKYMNLVVDLLSNLKQNIIQNITVQKSQTVSIEKNVSQLDRFHKLISKSNNRTKLTMNIATDTSGMVNDGIF